MSNSTASAIFQVVAYAIRNDQGYWTGIWNTREMAEKILKRGQASHRECIVELYIKVEDDARNRSSDQEG